MFGNGKRWTIKRYDDLEKRKDNIMTKTKVLALTTTLVIALCVNGINGVAFSKEVKNNIAVVDVQKVLESSPEINALKNDRKTKVSSLVSFVQKAKTDIAKENNQVKKKTLEDSYIKQINTKKESMDKEYIQNLTSIDKDINKIIKEKSSGYDLVLTKSSVLGGGTDITDSIIKELK